MPALLELQRALAAALLNEADGAVWAHVVGDAFTAAELHRLNEARPAGARFSPYDGPRKREAPDDRDRS